MSKKDYITGRMDGLKLALRIADRDGIDGIRKEIAYRNNGGINTRLSMQELDEADRIIRQYDGMDHIFARDMYLLFLDRIEHMERKTKEGGKVEK